MTEFAFTAISVGRLALSLHQAIQQRPRAEADRDTNNNELAAQLAHPRSPVVLAATPITCGACGGDFTA